MDIKNLFKPTANYEVSDTYPDGVIAINYQKNIIYWNKKAQEIFGFSRKEVLGKNIGFVLADEVEKVYQSLGENKSLILNVRNKNDQEIFIEISCADSETKEDVIITVRDFTKTQKFINALKSELERTAAISQNKSGFVASLSHELRTPVHSIIGFSQALSDGIGGKMTEKQDKYVSIINKNANNLLVLLNNLLDLSKIEAGKMDFNLKYFDVIQLINSTTEVIGDFAKNKKLEFNC
ncbi:MAG: PAS domain-containing protein [Desulfobacterales bacterium]|nr:PAS domain-containing protein [Desulfobacterales bacterium]